MARAALRATGMVLMFVGLDAMALPCAGEGEHSVSAYLRAKAQFYHHQNQRQGERTYALRYTRMEILRAKCKLGRKNKHQCQSIQQAAQGITQR